MEWKINLSTPLLLRVNLPNRELPWREVNESCIFREVSFTQLKEIKKRFLSADPFSDFNYEQLIKTYPLRMTVQKYFR